MKPQLLRRVSLSAIAYLIATATATAATVQERYYAHPAIHDQHGVIAPWYRGQNGPCDFRVRVAAETLKRYPWVTPPQAASAVAHYVFNGHWKIDSDGTITPIPIRDWDNGDLGQRAAYVLSRFTLLSKIGCIWRQGAAVYDECALEAAPAKE